MKLSRLDLSISILVMLVAGITGFGVIVHLPNAVRLPAGLLLSIFGTGYALLSVLLPRRNDHDQALERLWWSIPSSFVVAIFVGTALNLSPLHLKERPFALSMAGITCILLLLGGALNHFQASQRGEKLEDPAALEEGRALGSTGKT